jgi:hypothetical protein
MTAPDTPVDDPAVLEDLGAELDDTTDEPGDDVSTPVAATTYFTGPAVGGPPPYPGRTLVSRFSRGIVLVDRVRQLAWIYDYDPDGSGYHCRDNAGAPLDHDGRWRAAEGPDYEVRAYDPDFTGDEAPATATTVPADDGGDEYTQASA